MNSKPSNSDDALLVLFDRICAGDADAEALEQLQRTLRDQPEVAGKFLNYMAMHADIYGVVRLSRVRKIVECEVNAVEAPVAHTVRDSKLARFAPPVLAIAAMLFVGLVLVDREETAAPYVNWPNAVASLNRVEDVTWAKSCQPMRSITS